MEALQSNPQATIERTIAPPTMQLPNPKDIAIARTATLPIPDEYKAAIVQLLAETIQFDRRMVCQELQQELGEMRGAIEQLLYPKG